MYVIINVGTEQAYKRDNAVAVYKTSASAKAAQTRLNKAYGNTQQWIISTAEEWANRPRKTKTVISLMTGQPVEIDEDTPRSCDPSSELYWTM